jgi:hypothetical protein
MSETLAGATEAFGEVLAPPASAGAFELRGPRRYATSLAADAMR